MSNVVQMPRPMSGLAKSLLAAASVLILSGIGYGLYLHVSREHERSSALWARIEREAEEYKHKRRRESDEKVAWCLAKGGTAHVSSDLQFAGCTIPAGRP